VKFQEFQDIWEPCETVSAQKTSAQPAVSRSRACNFACDFCTDPETHVAEVFTCSAVVSGRRQNIANSHSKSVMAPSAELLRQLPLHGRQRRPRPYWVAYRREHLPSRAISRWTILHMLCWTHHRSSLTGQN